MLTTLFSKLILTLGSSSLSSSESFNHLVVMGLEPFRVAWSLTVLPNTAVVFSILLVKVGGSAIKDGVYV